MILYPITIPGGSDTQVQYNNGGIFGGDSALTWDDSAAKALTIGNCAVLGSDSALFQPNADSTTFFEAKLAAGSDFFILDTSTPKMRLSFVNPNDEDVLFELYSEEYGDNMLVIRKHTNSGGYVNFYSPQKWLGFEADNTVFKAVTSTKATNFQLEGGSTGYGGEISSYRGSMTIQTRSGGFGPYDLTFATDEINALIIDGDNQFISIGGNTNAETLVELEHATPYITLHNSTHEDTDGGRESRLNFKGEQSGGEETTLARIEASHDGATDDEKGKVVISTNAGSDTDTPTNQLMIQSTGDWVINKTSGVGVKVDLAAPTFGWRDITGEITNAGGANKPTSTTYRGGIDQFLFSAGDESIIRYHIPHDYVPGTDIHLHVHWSHISAIVTGGTVTFTAESIYAKGHNQAAFSAPVTGTFVGTASTTQYQHIISETQYSASTPAGLQIDTDDLEPDGVILVRLEMTTNNITSSGAVPDVFIHEVDVHYQSTNLGTKQKAPDFYT
jgi:hypothetical protein